MSRTPDGFLGRSPLHTPGFVVGVVFLAAGGAASILAPLWVAALPAVVGALVMWFAIGGTRRVRITVSKVLIEDERPVLAFLIGPIRARVPYEALVSAQVVFVAAKPAVRIEPGGVVLARGESRADLDWFVEHLEVARTRYLADK